MLPFILSFLEEGEVDMKNKLKLFIWIRFLSGLFKRLAFAIAKDEAEAKKLVEKERKGLDVY